MIRCDAQSRRLSVDRNTPGACAHSRLVPLCALQFSVGQEASIGFLRQAEIKHGRVAMAAFVGFCVQSNGIYWPWALNGDGVTHAQISAAGAPAAQWDALPTSAKVQILLFIGACYPHTDAPNHGGGTGCSGPYTVSAAAAAAGCCCCSSCTASAPDFSSVPPSLAPCAHFAEAPLLFAALSGFLEIMGENSYILEQSGQKHYMKGGKAGFYPSFQGIFPHPVPFDLFDPFKLSKNASPEKKAKGLLAEINNGRLAQLGIMAFVSESKVPGSVPLLSGKIAAYSGECMAPFSAIDSSLPFVKEMITYKLPF